MSLDQSSQEAAVDASPVQYFGSDWQEETRLGLFERYVLNTYDVYPEFKKLQDKRVGADIKTFDVVNCLFHAAVLRIPSFNALESELKTPEFQKLLGYKPTPKKACISADTLADVVDSLDVGALEDILAGVIKKAERNKAFRDDMYGHFRCVAVDGWEPFCSNVRHCENCLSREIKQKTTDENGYETIEKATQYYHRFVVAMLIAPRLDLVLALEPVHSSNIREDDAAGHEGELTAAKRLIDKLHKTYGRFIDAFALDALYANGPMLTHLQQYRYGAIICTKDGTRDPLRFANSIWQIQDKPTEVQEDVQKREIREYFELKDVDALKTFSGTVDMLKVVIRTQPAPRRENKSKTTSGRNINLNKPKSPKTSTWVMLKMGKAKKASRVTSERILRSRWHIENTAFHQWVTHWHLDHCFRHSHNGICVVMNLWAIAFNLMQLFFYRRLRKQRTGRPVTDTFKTLVRRMNMDLAHIRVPVAWTDFIAGCSSGNSS